MDNFPSLKEYLEKENLDSSTNCNLDELKRNYRRLYHREYSKRQKQQHTLTLRMQITVFKEFEQAKKKHNYTSINAFLLDLIQAYLKNEYVFPNKKDTQHLIKVITIISNDIRQVSQKIHRFCLRQNPTNGKPDASHKKLLSLLEAIELLHTEVEQYKTTISTFLQTPSLKLFDLPWDEIKNNQDGKLDQLITFLINHRNSLVDASD